MRIGIQMYSLRHDIERDGLDAVVESVARAGFDGVELAGYYGRTPQELKTLFDKNGLAVSGAHVSPDEILKETDKTLAYARTLNFGSIIVPWWEPEDVKKGFEKGLDVIRQCRQTVIDAGFAFGYHNHNAEFDGGDHLSALADAVPGLFLEVDMFWLASMGLSGADYLKRQGERVRLVHIKELSEKGTADYNPVVGEGTVDAGAILDYAKGHNIEWAILEAEKIALPYAEYIEKSCRFMKKYS